MCPKLEKCVLKHDFFFQKLEKCVQKLEKCVQKLKKCVQKLEKCAQQLENFRKKSGSQPQ